MGGKPSKTAPTVTPPLHEALDELVLPLPGRCTLVAVIGPEKCGKSTLIRWLGGSDKPVNCRKLTLYEPLASSALASSLVIFAEVCSKDVFALAWVLRLSSVMIVLSNYAGGSIEDTFGWVPAMSFWMRRRLQAPKAKTMLITVGHDSEKWWKPEAMAAMVSDSAEEQRNVCRFHARQLFGETLNPPMPLGRVKNPKKDRQHMYPRQVGRNINDIEQQVLKGIAPRLLWAADEGSVVCNADWSQVASEELACEPANLSIWAQESLAGGVHELHAHHAELHLQNHAKYMSELVNYNISIPHNPDQLATVYAANVAQVGDLLDRVVHVDTSDETRQNISTKLKEEAGKAFDILQERNSQSVETLFAAVVARAGAWVEVEALANIALPKPKPQVHAFIDRAAHSGLDSAMGEIENARRVLGSMRDQVEMRLLGHLSDSIEETMERNETAFAKIQETEAKMVKAQAHLKFRECQWLSRDNPYTSQELLQLIQEWVELQLGNVRRRLEHRMEPDRLDAFQHSLSADLRQLAASLVQENLGCATSKINYEVEDCLDFYRTQVLAPQLQSLLIDVASQTREYEDALVCLESNGISSAHTRQMQALMEPPKDFSAPFRRLPFLEKTFVGVLLERAEFLCQVCDVGHIHARVKHLRGGKMETKAALEFIPQGVPFLEMERPTVSQMLMDQLLFGGGLVGSHGVLAIVNGQPQDGGDVGFSPGMPIVDALSQLKALSADTIDHIWNNLKRMADEEATPLVRRQRVRDERYREMMEWLGDWEGASETLARFSRLFADELEGKASPTKAIEDRAAHTAEEPLPADAQDTLATIDEQPGLDTTTDRGGAFARAVKAQLNETSGMKNLELQLSNLAEMLGGQTEMITKQLGGLQDRLSKLETEQGAETTRLNEQIAALTAGNKSLKTKDAVHASRTAADDVRIKNALKALHAYSQDLDATERSLAQKATKKLHLRAKKERPEGDLPSRVSPTGKRPASSKPDTAAHDASSRTPVTSHCTRCDHTFSTLENHPMSCRFHRGKWDVKRRRGAVFAQVAASLIDKGGKYNENVDGRWTCCGEKDANAPGCSVDLHRER
eukprot:GEMP01002660.1.p1 GENE.GEMP01002660.1~~GEMP01002660.1.p1  ORF type:complete len:1081 (+),score=330.98 GEMP01002660.1:805-4047(+)